MREQMSQLEEGDEEPVVDMENFGRMRDAIKQALEQGAVGSEDDFDVTAYIEAMRSGS